MGFMDRIVGAYRALTKSQEVGHILGEPYEGQVDIQKSEPAREMKALMEDPLGMIQAMGYKDRQFSLSYDILRRMGTKDAVISSIITTRVNQVSSFTAPARFSKDGLGYEIRLRDTNETPSKKDQETMVAIEEFLENTGFDNDNERDDFDTFIRKVVRDRLIYDQVCFEIVPDRVGRPAEFYAVDASTIRLASEKLQEDNPQHIGLKKNEMVKYVQVIDGRLRAFFTADEMAFGTANPRTDMYISGYGFSELEMLIHQVTSHLWAEEYNSRFFSQGGTTKGILNFKGTANAPISPQQLDSFKRQWLSQVSGMTGAWKTPVVSVDGLEYINVSQSNREMEFEKWMNYLINVACAVYQIDPAEINFPNRGGAGNSGGGGLGNGGIEDRVEHSKDKGLRPLLRFIEALINKNIVSKFDQRYVFSFSGLDTKSEKEVVELDEKRVKVYKTVNEIRKEQGLPKLEGGDIILDSNYIQYLNNQAQQEQQEKMMAQQGAQGGQGDDGQGFGGKDVSGDKDDSKEDDDDGFDWTDDEDDGDEKEDTKKSLESEKLTGDIKFLTIEWDD